MDDATFKQKRTDAVEAVVNSNAPKKLIVAGPGTGKTYTFNELLTAITGSRIALTFITALADELKVALGAQADTYTLHAYCKKLLHKIAIEGVTRSFDYYPLLNVIQGEDLSVLGSSMTHDDIDRLFQTLTRSSLVDDALRSGEYYDAVGHVDAVYRMLRHFQQNIDEIPEHAQIVVDEYQDFSLLEKCFIDVLADKSPTLIVGDDDQALYGFKHASAAHLRQLANDPTWTRFELPFCTRCTPVLVDAVHLVVKRAQSIGLLKNRIAKQYVCFEPDKRADGARFPKITHAHCTLQKNDSQYMGRYIAEQIRKIPAADIADSRSNGFPTVLVIGPKPFTPSIAEYLKSLYSDVTVKTRISQAVNVLDGYVRLVKQEDSRLGWRIVMHVDPPDDIESILQKALVDGDELVDLLAQDYRSRHLVVVEALKAVLDESPTDEEVGQLEAATSLRLLEIERALGIGGEEPLPEVDLSEPSITVTTLLGAKGLQASYVFVVGLNEAHFPTNPTPSEDEVCELLVALTRARLKCFVISCGRLGGKQLRQSLFIGWLQPLMDRVLVDKDYIRALGDGVSS